MKRFLLTSACLFLMLIPTVEAADVDETIVILVRHGKTFYNDEGRCQGALDTPLNSLGIQQAELLAERLKDVPIDVFISSPLERAYLTTKKCADAQGKPIAYTDIRLKELDYGDWAGKLYSDIAKEYPKQYKLANEKPWKIKYPNGGTLKEMQSRYRAALDDAVARYPGKVIFIGAHSGGNAALLCDVLGLKLDSYKRIRQDNTCINVLQYKSGGWKVLLMNSVDHLGYLYNGMKKAA